MFHTQKESLTAYINISLVFLIFATLSSSTQACSVDGKEGFLKLENKRALFIEKSSKNSNNMTESEFNKIIDSIADIYRPIIESKYAKLIVEKNWDKPNVNAYARQTSQSKNWHIALFGGLARHKEITPDGFALVICHELGHHLGGIPKKINRYNWASSEGGADYFATTVCLRKYLEKQYDNVSVVSKMKVPTHVRKACHDSYKNIAIDLFA